MCTHISKNMRMLLNNSDTNGTWFCWWFGCSFCRMARCALGTPAWGHGASSYATPMRTKVRSYGWRFLGASMSQETSDCLVISRVWELWYYGDPKWLVWSSMVGRKWNHHPVVIWLVWNICYFPFHIWDNPSWWWQVVTAVFLLQDQVQQHSIAKWKEK
jgi:hypothetical protein